MENLIKTTAWKICPSSRFFWECSQGKPLAKCRIPQLRYIYTAIAVYIQFFCSSAFIFGFRCLPKADLAVACFHGWNTEPSRMFSDRISRFCQFWFWKTLIQLYFDWRPHQSQNSERAFVFVQFNLSIDLTCFSFWKTKSKGRKTNKHMKKKSF